MRMDMSGWVFLLVPAYPVVPDQRTLNGCVCVCACRQEVSDYVKTKSAEGKSTWLRIVHFVWHWYQTASSRFWLMQLYNNYFMLGVICFNMALIWLDTADNWHLICVHNVAVYGCWKSGGREWWSDVSETVGIRRRVMGWEMKQEADTDDSQVSAKHAFDVLKAYTA